MNVSKFLCWSLQLVVLTVWFFFQNFSLPFNKYAWITTHNAYAIYGETSLLGVTIVSQKNQEDSITSQLNVCSISLSADI